MPEGKTYQIDFQGKETNVVFQNSEFTTHGSIWTSGTSKSEWE